MTKTRLKFFTLKIGSGKTPRGGSSIYSESGVMLLRSQNVHFKGLRLDDVVFVSEEIDEDMKNTRVYSGDVLLNITGASLGRCTVAPSDFPSANVSQHVSIIRCNENRLNPQYLFYNLQGAEIQNKIWGDENGSSREGLTSQQIGDFLIEVIPLEDQNKVADYLDRETTQIDNLIAAKEQMLTLIEEKREALISHAVTRGLDPNVAFKRSGLDWLGDIPKHWEVKKLGYISSLKSGDTITADTIAKYGMYPVYGGNGLRGYTDSFTHNGDYVLIGRQGALCGNINYAHGKFWASEHAVVVTPLEKLDYRWLGESLRNMNLNQYSLSAAQPGIAIDRISALKIAVPPFEEQQSITSYLDQETSKLDRLLVAIKEAIALLKERRSALITATVTGQIALEEMTS